MLIMSQLASSDCGGNSTFVKMTVNLLYWCWRPTLKVHIRSCYTLTLRYITEPMNKHQFNDYVSLQSEQVCTLHETLTQNKVAKGRIQHQRLLKIGIYVTNTTFNRLRCCIVPIVKLLRDAYRSTSWLNISRVSFPVRFLKIFRVRRSRSINLITVSAI